MILVDTSIWIDAFRSAQAPTARRLTQLLEEDQVALAVPVRVEILIGASKRDLPRLRRSLSALPVVFPRDGTWHLVDEWVDRAVAAGERFGFADLLVAALAAERGWLLWSNDSDFARMQRLGFVKLHQPSLD